MTTNMFGFSPDSEDVIPGKYRLTGSKDASFRKPRLVRLFVIDNSPKLPEHNFGAFIPQQGQAGANMLQFR